MSQKSEGFGPGKTGYWHLRKHSFGPDLRPIYKVVWANTAAEAARKAGWTLIEFSVFKIVEEREVRELERAALDALRAADFSALEHGARTWTGPYQRIARAAVDLRAAEGSEGSDG